MRGKNYHIMRRLSSARISISGMAMIDGGYASGYTVDQCH